jgi:hypothetical protein
MIADPGCVRLENGVLTTQRDAPANLPPNAAGIFNSKTDCMNEGAIANIYAVVARRFPVVDEEAGTVPGLGVFLRKPGAAVRRNQFSEWFVIDRQAAGHLFLDVLPGPGRVGPQLAALRRKLACAACTEMADHFGETRAGRDPVTR